MLHGEFPCKDFHKGICKNDQCRFSHVPLTDYTRPIVDKLLADDGPRHQPSTYRQNPVANAAAAAAAANVMPRRRVLLPGGKARDQLIRISVFLFRAKFERIIPATCSSDSCPTTSSESYEWWTASSSSSRSSHDPEKRSSNVPSWRWRLFQRSSSSGTSARDSTTTNHRATTSQHTYASAAQSNVGKIHAPWPRSSSTSTPSWYSSAVSTNSREERPIAATV